MEVIKGHITIRDILLEQDNWQRFVEVNGDPIRPAVYDNIRRMLACRTPELGFHVYACPDCGEQRIVPHTCKSRLCSSCGKPATDRRAEQVLSQTLDVEYHHLVLSVEGVASSVGGCRGGSEGTRLYAASLRSSIWPSSRYAFSIHRSL